MLTSSAIEAARARVAGHVRRTPCSHSVLLSELTGSEIYPLAVRGAGTSVQSATLWSTNLLITLTLLSMIDLFGVGQVFWIYGLFNVAAWIFVWRLMPELTGHSLEDIESRLQDGRFRPKDFAKEPAQR